MRKILAALLVVAFAGAFTIGQEKATKPEQPKAPKTCCDMAKEGCDMKKAKDCPMKSASAKGGDCCKDGKMKSSKENTSKEKASKPM